ncbi:MAG: DegV family protein [Erysipelotrichaceae bacterium]|nr:DegV family protein [Erysipelotrichaceae bacterium]
MKIVTDTSALYSPKEGEEKRFIVLPLSVTFNHKTYKEYVDVQSDEFIDFIKAGAMPTTSQPSIGETIELFENNEDELLVITMADGLSGTYQSTVGAKESIENNERIHIINSMTLCGPQRHLVDKALELQKQGLDLESIKQEIYKCLTTEKSFLIPSDFDFLKRGGRLTPLAAKALGMLKIVPIMTLTEDSKKLETFKVKKTKKGAINEIIKCFKEIGVDESYKIYVTHAGVLVQAQQVVEQIKKSFKNVQIELYELSPVFITQGGPGCIAVQTIKI